MSAVSVDVGSNAPAQAAPAKEYGYRGGQLLVVFDSTQTGDEQLAWLVQDHLGSTRMIVNRSGSLAGIKRRDYLPFGEEPASTVGHRAASGSGYQTDDRPRQKFTGQERDTETGLDFMQARYYSNVQGRFISPDEVLADQIKSIPQSWNLYTYVRNNPLAYIDPSGRVTCRPDGTCVGDWDGEQNGKLFWNERKQYWESYQEFKLRRTIEAFARSLHLEERHKRLFREQDKPSAKLAAAGVMLIRLPKVNPVITTGLAVVTIGYVASTWNHAPAPIPMGTVNYFNRPWTPPAPPLVIDPNIFARKPDLELVDTIADEFDIPRDLLSDEIHEYKKKTGRRGNDNLGKEKIREIAKEIKDVLDSSK